MAGCGVAKWQSSKLGPSDQCRKAVCHVCRKHLIACCQTIRGYGWKIASGPGVRLRSLITAGNTLILQGSSSLSCHPVRAGGQKVKVVLAAAMWNSPHMLVLDEPTNYLDRESLGALAAAIKEYGGGVVMISHHSGARPCNAMPVCRQSCMLEKIA